MIGIERCRTFLRPAGEQIARRLAAAIGRQFALLERSPEIGRLFEDHTSLRELLVPFGQSGYAALYRYEPADNTVYILAFRHQREAGY